MLSKYAVENFRTYLKVTPKHLLGEAPPDRPLGAYDSKYGALDHGFGRAIRPSDFERGGVFDRRRLATDKSDDVEAESGETSPSRTEKLLRFIAGKLSPADWADLQLLLKRDDAEDAKIDYKDPFYDDRIDLKSVNDRKAHDRNMATDSKPRDSFAKRFPDAARIRIGM